MIKLRLSFGEQNKGDFEVEIIEGELLSDAVKRATENVPLSGHEPHEMFKVIVNGHMIEPDFWKFTQLRPIDSVLIVPDIKSGESGQIFKQAAIIAITVVATSLLGPAGAGLSGASLALATAAVTIAATLALNALIPPPVPELGGLSGVQGYESSQMYSIAGQSNQAKRFQTVPKVYGAHRMFPNIAAVPYAQLELDPESNELSQYLYAIYDFGLGPVNVNDIKIGDTPLTDENFTQYQFRFVDPNKPADGDPEEDFLTNVLNPTFELYKGDNEGTALAVGLDGNSFDGDDIATYEAIRNSAPNTDGSGQEIILAFVNPSGLYSFNATGDRSYRQIELNIEFSKVGEDVWRKYNDTTYVSDFQSVGGEAVSTDFLATVPHYSQYFGPMSASLVYELRSVYSYVGGFVSVKHVIGFKPNSSRILLDAIAPIAVGSSVFFGSQFLGNIDSFTIYDTDKYLVQLDRNFTNKSGLFYYSTDFNEFISNVNGTPKFRIHTQSIGRATIKREDLNPVYSNFRFTPIEPAQYKVRVQRLYTQSPYTTNVQDHLVWASLTTRFKRPPVLTEKRHTFMEIKIKATNQFNGTISDLSAVALSLIDVYDTETETWIKQPSNNPAWVFADLLTGEVNKKPIPKERLHLPSLIEWAEFCEEIPDPAPPDQEYTLQRFSCNFVLDYTAALQAVIGQVTGAAQASMNIIDGKYGVLIDRLKTTPVQIFTPRNSKNFSSTRIYTSRPHGVNVKYIDPNLDWAVSEIVAYDNDYNADNATDVQDLTSFACTNNEQAWRFGRYMIAQNRLRQETIQITVDFENLVCTRGDFVQITQDVMRVGGTPARVKEVIGDDVIIDDSLEIDGDLDYGYVYRAADGTIHTNTLEAVTPNRFTLDGDIPAVGDLIIVGVVGSIVFDCIVKSISPNDDLSAELVLVEKADGIYAYESSGVLPDYDPQISPSSNPDIKPPNPVQNLTVADNAHTCSNQGEGYVYYIDITWDLPFNSIYEFFSVNVNSGSGYQEVATTKSTVYRYIVNENNLGFQHGIKVIAVSATGKKLNLNAVPTVTATPVEKTTPPSDVETLSSNITNEILQLSWPLIPDCDAKEYTLKYSPDVTSTWDEAVALVKVNNKVNSVLVQARTGIYYIKASDFNGNVSENAAAALTTIPTLFNLNVIAEINEDDDHEGEFVQTELDLDDDIVLQKEVPGAPGTYQYYSEGYYNYGTILDLGEVYTVRLQALVQAEGFSDGDAVTDITHNDWDVEVQYRASATLDVISEWDLLSDIEFMSIGDDDLTEWRTFTMGDATGRVFQFRIHLKSNNLSVTPKVFNTTIKADMPDRVESYENLTSDATMGYELIYEDKFTGPLPSPNVQISIDGYVTGDYWNFDYKTTEGFLIKFFDEDDNPVSKTFDVVVKGYGKLYTSVI